MFNPSYIPDFDRFCPSMGQSTDSFLLILMARFLIGPFNIFVWQHLAALHPGSTRPNWNCWWKKSSQALDMENLPFVQRFHLLYHLSQMVQIFFQPHQLQHPILVRFFATRNQQPILFLDFINPCLHPPLFCCSNCKWTTVQRGGLGSVVIIVCTPSVTKDSVKRLTKVFQIWRSLHFTWS